jgi:predicted negative regulator of RcsB-dependent stress response
VARITRKELKTDKFALEVEHTVTFFEEHRREIVRYGGIGLAAILVVFGYTVYSRHRHVDREQALTQAIAAQEAAVGAATSGMTFPTQEAKDQATQKAFTEIRTKYSGSNEADIAGYYLGAIQADQGKMAEAEKTFRDVADRADAKYASLAKLSLAQVYFAEGKKDEGEKLLRDLMAHPTIFVSKDQATMSLARQLLSTKPEEARQLITPFFNRNDAVGQAALTMSADLPRK